MTKGTAWPPSIPSRRSLQDKLDIDPSKVDGNSTFESLNVDSLDMVELICELEDQLDIDFGEPEGLNTIDELVAYIDSL